MATSYPYIGHTAIDFQRIIIIYRFPQEKASFFYLNTVVWAIKKGAGLEPAPLASR
jgi:hypothetical protein